MVRASRRRLVPATALVGLLAVGLGCTGVLRIPVGYRYFVAPDPGDPWTGKIADWQQRERSERRAEPIVAPAPVAGAGGDEAATAGPDPSLLAKYTAFRAERKRALARELAEWIQAQAQLHYRPDGPVDRWATLAETFRSNGDDCDGLELLTFNLLHEFGFGEDEVYRAIVVRRSDGQHHMVTLWFEDRDDPWVIDPTGAMTVGMPRMSDEPEWTPIKVFGLDRSFSVQKRELAEVRR